MNRSAPRADDDDCEGDDEFDDIVDPDVDLHDTEHCPQARDNVRTRGDPCGGVVGAEARYGVGVALPTPARSSRCRRC